MIQRAPTSRIGTFKTPCFFCVFSWGGGGGRGSLLKSQMFLIIIRVFFYEEFHKGCLIAS